MAVDPDVLPLRFAWWNTGVAPSVSRPVDSGHEAKAIGVVSRLVVQEGCALIGLAEVCRQRIWDWLPVAERPHWGSISPRMDADDGYDLGVLYDRRQLVTGALYPPWRTSLGRPKTSHAQTVHG
jgi:hypothetical protein